ncbi:MAG: cupin [Nitrospirae bacterium]|nr:cupin [Nitrospirota bacterium]
MSILTLHAETGPAASAVHTDLDGIQKQLADIGVLFERWRADRELGPAPAQDQVLAAYADPVARLKALYGFQSADVISVAPDNPAKAELRAKFLREHTHSDYEVRFFVQGRGLFYLHPDQRVFGILCAAGDLISVPAGARHWFDLGETPSLSCIRLFTTPEGWVADYTGSAIAQRFPTLEGYLAAHG